ncbi:hypothetical protein BCR37DRAFT_243239 [Protomyces lactucae-debilis]|uniref:3'-5' exonuclease n=1 Tax=Protomyces lactucae-debilis TaxID=2754530 RepID=A0A1Y2FPQ5_PROLT|nr:uncharacterized protein BCR37DRAFT_243239 [Protomyces lactucae-debilis]ORY85587.1 hypothetical protein BCR37DRAFT_243239 [Protomyces lactucae-debilis]
MPATMTGVHPAIQAAAAEDEDDASMANSDDSALEGVAHNTSSADISPDGNDRPPGPANDLSGVQSDIYPDQVPSDGINNDDPNTEPIPTEESDGNSAEVELINEIRAKIQNKRIKLYEGGLSPWIHPPDPQSHLVDNPNDVNVLFHPSVFVWHPALWSRTGNSTGKIDEEGRLPCPRCQVGLRFKGWCNSPTARRIHDDGRHFLLMAYRYCCKNSFCSLETISASDTELLESLPYGLQVTFPAILTHRSGISKTLFERFQDTVANGSGPDPFRQMLNNSAMRKFQALNAIYLSNIKEFLSRKQTDIRTSFNADMPKSADKFRSFGEFNDPLRYNGLVPSVHWLTDLFTKEMTRQKPKLDKRTSMLSGTNFGHDATYKGAMRLCAPDGTMIMVGVWTIVNEYNEVLGHLLTPTNGVDNLVAVLKAIESDLNYYHGQGFVVCYTDNPKHDRKMMQASIKSLVAGVEPVAQYEAPLETAKLTYGVKVLAKEAEIDEAILKNILEDANDAAKSGKEIVVGLDAEWDSGPSAGRGIDIIQIAYNESVHVLRVSKFTKDNGGQLPRSLIMLLEHPSVRKTGCCVQGDLTRINKAFGLSCVGALELGSVIVQRGFADKAQGSLTKFTEVVLGKHLPKPEVRTGKWSAENLTNEQAEYAALDAQISLQIYHEATRHPSDGMLTSQAKPNDLVTLFTNDGTREVAQGRLAAEDQKMKKRKNASNSVVVIVDKILVESLIPGSWLDQIVPATTIEGQQLILRRYCVRPRRLPGSHRKDSVQTEPVAEHYKPFQPSFFPLQTTIDELDDEHMVETTVDDELEEDSLGEIDVLLGALQAGDLSVDHNARAAFADVAAQIETQPDTLVSSSDALLSASHAGIVEASAERQGTVPRLYSRVLDDSFHFMNRVKWPKKHMLHAAFRREFSNAIFAINSEDKALVEAFLSREGNTWEDACRYKPKWIRRHVRRFIPEPNVLYIRVKALFDYVAGIECAATKKPFITPDMLKDVANLLESIKAGHLSDPPGVCLHHQSGSSQGLPIWRSVRGTSRNEVFHRSTNQRNSIIHGSYQYGVSWMTLQRSRYNLRVGMRWRHGICWKGGYNFELLDQLKMLHIELGIPVPEVLRHWVVVDEYADRDSRYLDQRFGVARLSPELCTSHGFEPYAKDEQVHGYLASQFGTKFAVAPVTTKAERDLCRLALDEWQRSSGRLNILPSAEGYMHITRAVNKKADGQIMQYKLVDHVRKFFESDEKKRMNDTMTNFLHSSAMRRIAAGYQARLSTETRYITSSDPIVRNLGPTRPPEQPVRLMNFAAPAPAPRPVDPSAPEIFIQKGKHSSDVRRVCKSCSLKTCGALKAVHCVLHPSSLSRAERSVRSGKLKPDILRLWNCWHVLQYERKRNAGLTLPSACTTNRIKLLDKLHSGMGSRSSKLLGFLQSDANLIQDVLKAYIEERIVYNPFV